MPPTYLSGPYLISSIPTGYSKLPSKADLSKIRYRTNRAGLSRLQIPSITLPFFFLKNKHDLECFADLELTAATVCRPAIQSR